MVCPRNKGIQRKEFFRMYTYIKRSVKECVADKMFNDVNCPTE
jgi:hypothetical protein